MGKLIAVMFIITFILGAVMLLSVIHAEDGSGVPDTDGDGIPDDVDVDTDGDGMPDIVEFVMGTDPFDETSVVYVENLTEFVQQILENMTIETDS